MGLLSFIRHEMPDALDRAARSMKMKDELCHRIYDAIPSCWKNNKKAQQAINRIRAVFISVKRGENIIYYIDVTGLPDKRVKDFIKLGNKAIELQEQCK